MDTDIFRDWEKQYFKAYKKQTGISLDNFASKQKKQVRIAGLLKSKSILVSNIDFLGEGVVHDTEADTAAATAQIKKLSKAGSLEHAYKTRQTENNNRIGEQEKEDWADNDRYTEYTDEEIDALLYGREEIASSSSAASLSTSSSSLTPATTGVVPIQSPLSSRSSLPNDLFGKRKRSEGNTAELPGRTTAYSFDKKVQSTQIYLSKDDKV
ncbi:hypothetical protein BGZ49_001890 [Haplosporangium sp. Z 27]|nr:hypothetical protein BGZ49_001890 [Haplosporangium sp. Z 27]